VDTLVEVVRTIAVVVAIKSVILYTLTTFAENHGR